MPKSTKPPCSTSSSFFFLLLLPLPPSSSTQQTIEPSQRKKGRKEKLERQGRKTRSVNPYVPHSSSKHSPSTRGDGHPRVSHTAVSAAPLSRGSLGPIRLQRRNRHRAPGRRRHRQSSAAWRTDASQVLCVMCALHCVTKVKSDSNARGSLFGCPIPTLSGNCTVRSQRIGKCRDKCK